MGHKIKVTIVNLDNKEVWVDDGVPVSELLSYFDNKDDFIAAKVNNEVTSLSYKIHVTSRVEFITISDSLGMEVYRRTLSFLLEKVVKKLFPERRLKIGHSLGPGYYFDLFGAPLLKKEVEQIERELKREVELNLPITREKISYEDALLYCKTNGRLDKYELIESLNMPKFSIYRCEDFFQIIDLPLANKTGILKTFKLIYYPPGFILQFPKRSSPSQVAPFTEQRRIFEVYQEYKKWGEILKISNVGGLNKIINNNQIRDFILVAEALHSSKINHIANEIYLKKDRIKLISIAGPSSSGKTTFSKRLMIELKMLGLNPLVISVDNYFVDREKTPKGEDGKPDYETIQAINIEELNKDLDSLLSGKSVKKRIYDFYSGKSLMSEETLTLGEDEIIILEGIHCLNEVLTYIIPRDKKFKIYVSVLTQMNLDDNNRIPTTDNRVIRRMIRDHKYRGHSALKTFQMWPSVREGEERYIFPFQNEADAYFNSALDYELALLKPFAEPLLLQIKPYHAEYAEASRLLRFLSYFIPIQSKDVPANSIIREFIGGSSFTY